MTRTHSHASFFLLPTRIWEFGLGVITAIAVVPIQRSVSSGLQNAFAFCGVLAIVVSVLFFDKTTPTPSHFTLVPTVGAALLIAFATPITVVGKLLCWRPLVFVGLVSYSLYLWHQPVLAFARHRTFGNIDDIRLQLLVFIFICSYLGWRFVEVPMRSSEFPRKYFAGLVIIVGVILVTFGVSGHVTGGFKDRKIVHLEKLVNLELGNYLYDNNKLREQSWGLLDEESAEGNALPALAELRSGLVEFNPLDAREKMLIVGDSHSKDIYNLFRSLEEISLKFQLGRYGAEVVDLGHEFFSSKLLDESDVIVIASRFNDNDLKSLPETVTRLVMLEKSVYLVHRMFEFTYSEPFNLADNIVLKNISDTNGLLRKVDLLVNQAYTDEYNMERNQQVAFVNSKETLQNLAKRYSGSVQLIDRMRYICPSPDTCYGMASDYSKLFYDYGHHTLDGVRFFSDIINELGFSHMIVD